MLTLYDSKPVKNKFLGGIEKNRQQIYFLQILSYLVRDTCVYCVVLPSLCCKSFLACSVL